MWGAAPPRPRSAHLPLACPCPLQVVNRLSDRRAAADKELLALGEAKKGMNDIFRHCRGFERAYSAMLQEANTSFKIRGVVEGGLPEMLRKIPIEKRFNKNYVREICREADGYQPHIVSPERGIKRLVQEAMSLTSDHVHKFVDEIHMVLVDTVRESARRSVLSEAGVVDFNSAGRLEFLRIKGFETAVIVAAGQALEEWKKEAHHGALGAGLWARLSPLDAGLGGWAAGAAGLQLGFGRRTGMLGWLEWGRRQAAGARQPAAVALGCIAIVPHRGAAWG